MNNKLLSIQRSIFCFALLSLLISQSATAETSTIIASSIISRRHAITTHPSIGQSNSSNNISRRVKNPASSPALDASVLRVRGGAFAPKTLTTKEKLDLHDMKIKKVELAVDFFRIAIGSMVESFVMYNVLDLVSLLAVERKNEPLFTAIQFSMIASVVFGSSLYGSLLFGNGSLSAATTQVSSPSDVPGDSDWYQNLKKPSWNPPGWVFPIMWLIISKPTQFLALWKLRTVKCIRVPLAVYCTHLALGDAWNKIFFGLQQIEVGAAVISAFWAFLVASAALFYQKDPSAGLFLVPTCLWVTVATSLNWSIYNKN